MPSKYASTCWYLRLIVPVIGLVSSAGGCGPLRSSAVSPDGRVVSLRTALVPDSVVIRRDTLTILLSMRDVEERAAVVGYDPNGRRADFYRLVRTEYARNGWVQLDFT